MVLHQPRCHPDRLLEALGATCPLPVLEAEDKEPLAPSIVCLAPPDYHLLVDRGPSLALSVDERA